MAAPRPAGWAPTGDTAHEDSFATSRLPPPEAWPAIDFTTLPELAAYPDRINAAALLLDRQAERHGRRRALVAPDGAAWSYADLLERANRIAGVLRHELGLRPGNRVLLRSANNPMYAACWLAVQKAGGIAVATMPLLRARELAHILDAAAVGFALCDTRLLDELAAACGRARAAPKVLAFNGAGPDGLEARMARRTDAFETLDTAADDVALIAFTSGTTGPPKGCIHFHRDVMAICDTVAGHVIRPAPGDLFAGTPPLAFTFGLGALLLFPLYAGAASLLLESCTPESLLAAVREHGVDILFTAPTMYRSLAPLAAVGGTGRLAKSVSAGETLPKPTFDAWHDATGIRTIDGLGSTELLHMFIAERPEAMRGGCTGRPVPGYRACVLDGHGQPVPPGTVGRLAVRGPTGCRYLDDPVRQAAYVHDGWNLTGDAYACDGDGYYVYQARTDDMIVSAGYNISGPEVEAVLLEHPLVAECAVVGAADPARGQVVTAHVVLRDGAARDAATVKALQDHVKATIAPYKYPRAVHFRDSLPRTGTGKLQRFLLRQEGDGSR